VKSEINEDFLEAYHKLPKEIREQARSAYRLFREDPNLPGLRFKHLQGTDIYSVRIGIHYRALGTITGDTITWFWIGHRSELEKMLSQ